MSLFKSIHIFFLAPHSTGINSLHHDNQIHLPSHVVWSCPCIENALQLISYKISYTLPSSNTRYTQNNIQLYLTPLIGNNQRLCSLQSHPTQSTYSFPVVCSYPSAVHPQATASCNKSCDLSDLPHTQDQYCPFSTPFYLNGFLLVVIRYGNAL